MKILFDTGKPANGPTGKPKSQEAFVICIENTRYMDSNWIDSIHYFAIFNPQNSILIAGQ
jgi:hypothetical protein